MAEPKKPQPQEHPLDRRERDSAEDRPRKRRDYAAGADGEQDVNAGPTEADEPSRPDRDGTGW